MRQNYLVMPYAISFIKSILLSFYCIVLGLIKNTILINQNHTKLIGFHILVRIFGSAIRF